MSQTDTASHNHTRSEPRAGSLQPSMLDRIARRAVVHRLDQLTHGRVTLHDSVSQSSHGADSDARGGAIRVHDPRMFRETVVAGGLGFAESYLDARWDSPDLTELLRVFVRDVQIAHQSDRGLARLRLPILRGEE